MAEVGVAIAAEALRLSVVAIGVVEEAVAETAVVVAGIGARVVGAPDPAAAVVETVVAAVASA